MNENQPDLSSARHEIESVDKELMRLLKKRMDAVQSVAASKHERADAKLHDPEREAQLAGEWEAEAESLGLSPYHAGRILREVLNYSRRSQEPLLSGDSDRAHRRVGYQGVAASYSDLAIGKLFAHRAPTGVERIGYPSFTDVFDALETGEVDCALLPIENTLVGSIGEVSQLLATRDVAVIDEEVWEVDHCLAGLPGSSALDLRTIRSHPVALQQCQRLLGSLTGAASEPYFDTAGAAQSVLDAGDPKIGCICSNDAAQRFGLEVLRTGVADHAHNVTRFVLLAREQETANQKLPTKTSVHFSVSDRCGALAESLTAFSKHGVNLVRLESRPQPESPSESLFMVDLTGHQKDDAVKAALADLERCCHHVRILGSYASRSLEREVIPVKTKLPESVPAEAKKPQALSAESASRPKFHIGELPIGGDQFTLILGPCAVENRTQIHDAATMAKAHRARMLRGGAFKPRSSPHSFQGLGFEGLDLLAETGRAFEMPVVTEVLQPEDVDAIAAQSDVLQVGARNMQNFALLKKLGKTRRPILLKRGMSATVKELLQAAEYIKDGGNQRILLCERGIRTFETATRNTLDISAIPVLKSMTDLPVIVDPSHAAGVRHLVVPLALAATAAGADGLIIECHPRPEEALCDKDQALTNTELDALVSGLLPILAAQGRTL